METIAAESLPALPLWLDLAAVAFGAVSASATAEDAQRGGRRIDWLGVMILGIAVGLGGGFMRDLLIGVPPATMQSNWYILTAAGAALIGMWLSIALAKVNWMVIALDAASLGFFCLVGTAKALSFGMDALPAIMIGTVAAAGGGAVRDVLLQMPVGVLYAGTFYAAAAFFGSGVYVAVHLFGGNTLSAMIACWFVTVAIRLASVRWGLSLPEQMALRFPERGRIRRRRGWREAKLTTGANAEPPTHTSQLPVVQVRRDRDDEGGAVVH